MISVEHYSSKKADRATMGSWVYSKSRKNRKRKKDDFWSDYLRRNCQDNDKLLKIVRNKREPKYLTKCLNAGGYHETTSGRDANVIRVSDSDRSQYETNVFNKIFGKKFEGKTIRRISSHSETETYHFCLK